MLAVPFIVKSFAKVRIFYVSGKYFTIFCYLITIIDLVFWPFGENDVPLHSISKRGCAYFDTHPHGFDRKSDTNALYNASIKDENSKGFVSFAFPEAKSSKTGVSVRYAPCIEREWYVLRIKYGQAQAVADAIIEYGTYVYLAKVWKDIRNKETSKKQRKLFPFMNLLFAYMTEQEAEKYVKDSSVSKYTTYYYNHFVTDKQGYNPPLVVSSRDMEPFVKATSLLDEHVMEVDLNTCKFLSDDFVRVTGGPFEGITGRVARIARQKRVVIQIKGLQTGLTTAYIPPHFLEKVENDA